MVTDAADSRGNSNDSIRRNNLSLVLRLVHRSQGIPRSAITRQTGLNRSTVAALVGELVERDLLVEAEPDARNQVGRPSPLTLPSDTPVSFAVNPEIDAVTLGVVGLGGRVLRRLRVPTGGVPTADEAVSITASALADLHAEFSVGHRIVGVGVAVPGLVRARDGLVRLAPHLLWNDEPFAEKLQDATGLPVRADNDANVGIVAESIFGAGRGVADLIYLNGGSSGIGGGIISGGRPIGGADGYAGEFGHTLVRSEGETCHCGASGCLETEVRRDRLLELTGLVDADSDELDAALLASTAPEVRREVERQLDYLAVVLRNAINTLNPSTVVLGGFLGSLYAVAPDHLDALVAAQPLRASREAITITRAQLGANLLMIGAAELAFDSVLDDPSS
jgi:predicted NBD/HSP70 family sugar kinase